MLSKPMIFTSNKYSFLSDLLMYLAQSPEMSMVNICQVRQASFFLPLHKNANCNSWLNFKYIFILGTVRQTFFLGGVAM